MSTDDTIARRRVWPRYTLAVVAVIASSYLASFGPSHSLAERGMIPMDLCHYVFLPLPAALKQQYWVCGHVSTPSVPSGICCRHLSSHCHDNAAFPCAAANGSVTSLLQAGRPRLAIAELESSGRTATRRTLFLHTIYETLTDSDFAPCPMEVGSLKNMETNRKGK